MLNVSYFAARAEDPRMVWLKDQYLFLYFQDDLCMGPLAADAIKASVKLPEPICSRSYGIYSEIILMIIQDADLNCISQYLFIL